MKSLFFCLIAGLLSLSPTFASTPPIKVRQPICQRTDDPIETVLQAYEYAVAVVGTDPCTALRVAQGYPTVTQPQQYVHDRLAEVGYNFPTPIGPFACPAY